MSKPLTKERRENWKAWAEAIVEAGPAKTFPFDAYVKAGEFLAYEASLQAKDATIAALVDGILDIDEWMSGRSSHICPFCKGLIGEHKETCLRNLPIVQAAIKEATDAS